MKRYKPHGSNRWCGPAAISALTGVSTDDAGLMIREYTSRVRATGTSTHDVAIVLYKLGYELNCEKRWPVSEQRMTLAKWLRTRTHEQRNRTYLVEVTGHWMVISGKQGCDNHTGDWVFTGALPFRRKRVVAIHEVTRNLELDVTDVSALKAAKRKKASKNVGLQARLRKQADSIGVACSWQRHSFYGGNAWYELELDAPEGYTFECGSSYRYLDGSWLEVYTEASLVMAQGVIPAS